MNACQAIFACHKSSKQSRLVSFTILNCLRAGCLLSYNCVFCWNIIAKKKEITVSWLVKTFDVINSNIIDIYRQLDRQYHFINSDKYNLRSNNAMPNTNSMKRTIGYNAARDWNRKKWNI